MSGVKTFIIEQREGPTELGPWGLPCAITAMTGEHDAQDWTEAKRHTRMGKRYWAQRRSIEVVYATELTALRIVADVAGEHIASRGKIQERTPLHEALAAYYRTLAGGGR